MSVCVDLYLHPTVCVRGVQRKDIAFNKRHCCWTELSGRLQESGLCRIVSSVGLARECGPGNKDVWCNRTGVDIPRARSLLFLASILVVRMWCNSKTTMPGVTRVSSSIPRSTITKSISFVVSRSTASLSHRKPVSTVTSCDRCHDHGNDIRKNSANRCVLIKAVNCMWRIYRFCCVWSVSTCTCGRSSNSLAQWLVYVPPALRLHCNFTFYTVYVLHIILKVNRVISPVIRQLACRFDGIAQSSVWGTIFVCHVDQHSSSNRQLIITFSDGVPIPSMLNLLYEVSHIHQSTMFVINL